MKWHDLGVELLDFGDVEELDKIEAQYQSDLDKCCTKMFQLWLRKQPSATWNKLLDALRQPGIELHALANKIEQMLLQPKPEGYLVNYVFCMSACMIDLHIAYTCNRGICIYRRVSCEKSKTINVCEGNAVITHTVYVEIFVVVLLK